MINILYLFVFVFFIFLILYPYIYFKPLGVIHVSSSGITYDLLSYRFLKSLKRLRYGSYLIFIREDPSLPVIKSGVIDIHGDIYIVSRGLLGRYVTLDPSSQLFKSFLKNEVHYE